MPVTYSEEMTAEQLRNLAERLQSASADLQAVVASMKVQKFDSLTITKHNLMMRSIKGIETYVKASWDAYHDARESQEHYGPAKKTKKTSKK